MYGAYLGGQGRSGPICISFSKKENKDVLLFVQIARTIRKYT